MTNDNDRANEPSLQKRNIFGVTVPFPFPFQDWQCIYPLQRYLFISQSYASSRQFCSRCINPCETVLSGFNLWVTIILSVRKHFTKWAQRSFSQWHKKNKLCSSWLFLIPQPWNMLRATNFSCRKVWKQKLCSLVQHSQSLSWTAIVFTSGSVLICIFWNSGSEARNFVEPLFFFCVSRKQSYRGKALQMCNGEDPHREAATV